MWMKYFLLDDTNVTSSDMSITCDTSINVSKDKCTPLGGPGAGGAGGAGGRRPSDGDTKCSCDEQLVKFKAFFFLFFAGFGSTFPYLGVYFKQIGLNASYVGVLAGIRPLIQFLSGPFWALLADKYKARRGILLFSILAWLVMTLLLAFPRPQHVVCRVNVNYARTSQHNSNNTTNDNNNNNNNNKLNGNSNNNKDLKRSRSIIPYPDDLQGRFGFNLIYPHHCSNNTRQTRGRRENGERSGAGVLSQRKARFLYNSSEMVLSLEYDDDSNHGYWTDKQWKRGQVSADDKNNKNNQNHSNDNNNNNDKSSNEDMYYIERDEGEITELFYIFLTLIVVGEFLEAPSFIMIDTALLDHLGTEKKHYGKTRLFGSIGYGVASFSVGALLDRFQYTYCGKTLTNYLVIFYIFAASMVIAFLFGLCFIKFRYTDTKESSRPMDCVRVFMCIKYSSFLLICWFCGFAHGGIMNFLNWFLEDLGASKLMMGVATACRCSAIIFGFFCSSYFIDRVGHIALICWALASYVGSFFGYSLLTNPWWAIPIEVIQGLIYAISWSSCITYLGDIAPPNTAATMQGILQGVYWGLGTGSGTIAGGFLINHVGVRTAFRIGGSVGTVVFVLFVALQCWIAKKEKSTQQQTQQQQQQQPQQQPCSRR